MANGKSSRRKGKRNEYQSRDEYRDAGLACARVPLSGAWSGMKDDLRLCPHMPQHDPFTCPSSYKIEVKCRAKRPDYIDLWLSGDWLEWRSDRKDPLIVMTKPMLCELLRKAHQRMK